MQNGYLGPADFGGGDISDILNLGQNDSQNQRLALQMKLANQLRQTSPPQGQNIPQGSTFIPPNPLSTGLQMFDHIQSIVADAQGKKKGDALDKDRAKGLAHFAKMWFNKNGQVDDPNDQQQGPPTPQTPNANDQYDTDEDAQADM